MVQKEIQCPYCKKTMPFSGGFRHDSDLNLLCSNCNRIIFGVTPQAEEQLKKHTVVYRKEPLPITLGIEPEPEPEPQTAPSSEGKQILNEMQRCFC